MFKLFKTNYVGILYDTKTDFLGRFKRAFEFITLHCSISGSVGVLQQQLFEEMAPERSNKYGRANNAVIREISTRVSML